MTIQTLISTMFQDDHSLLTKMNIQTDAIVVNQCDKNEIEEFEFRGHRILWMSLNERGVGLSRNTALMRATADILLFADDDVIYENEYASKVIQEFEDNPGISLITFNLASLNPNRPEYIVNKKTRLTKINCLRYGAFRIAVRREIILHNTITFSLLFGGGAQYSAGEDNLFIIQCLKNKMRGLASEIMIGVVEQKCSTWFKEYNEKYYFDRGVLMYLLYGNLAYIFIRILNRRQRTNEHFDYKLKNKKSMDGIRHCKNIIRY